MNKEEIKQQAREMAERCAAELHSEFSDEWFRGLSPELHSNHYPEYEVLYKNAKEERCKIAETILRELNLVALLEDKELMNFLDAGYHRPEFLIRLGQDARAELRKAMEERSGK